MHPSLEMASLPTVGQPLVDSSSNSLLDSLKFLDNMRFPTMVNSTVKKYRAIAPRPIVPIVETSSPSSSVDNGSQPTSPITVVKEKKGRKRLATSSSTEKRPARDSKAFSQGNSKNLLNFNAVDKLSALDGTPLGKLLRATPDIHVPTCSSSLSFDTNVAKPSPFSSRYSTNTWETKLNPCSSSFEATMDKPEPVTLSLLPETPANSSISTIDSCLKPNLSKYVTPHASDTRLSAEAGLSKSETKFNDTEFFSKQDSDSIIDSKFMDSTYGGLDCPVLLTEENGEILWFNLSLHQLMKDSNSFNSLIMSSPLPVSRMKFFSSVKARFCNAILWAVLRKDSSETRSSKTISSVKLQNQLSFDSPAGLETQHPAKRRLVDNCSNSSPVIASVPPVSVESKVIRPSAVRLVKSTINLQEVCSLEQLVGPVKGSFDLMKNQADQWNIPVILTDSNFQVKWVNSSYKSIVSQNEASVLNSDDACHLLNGMIGKVEMQGMEQPCSSSAISSIVTVEWKKDGEERFRKFAGLAIRLEDMLSKPIGYLWCLYKIPSLSN